MVKIPVVEQGQEPAEKEQKKETTAQNQNQKDTGSTASFSETMKEREETKSSGGIRPPGKKPDLGRFKKREGSGSSRKDPRGRKSEADKKAEKEQLEYDAMLRDSAVFTNDFALLLISGIVKKEIAIVPRQKEALDNSLAEIFRKYDWLFGQYMAEITYIGAWASVLVLNKFVGPDGDMEIRQSVEKDK